MKNEMVNILFDNYKSYDDWKLMLEKMEISFPEPKENKVSVPGMDGVLDLSETLSPIAYNERNVQFVFSLVGNYEDWHSRSSEIANSIHGRKVKIILDTDPGYYYIGRVRLESTKDDDVLENIIISGTVDPYKYEINDGTEKWKWNPFSLRDGIIREYGNIAINGNGTVNIIGRRKRAIPTITCSAPMVLTYGKLTINLPAGITKVYELQLGEGEHILTFTGNGTVTISYRGGSL